ncbi:MAG: hypothetical protein ACHQF0_00280 [Chitinophagales bacterium]
MNQNILFQKESDQKKSIVDQGILESFYRLKNYCEQEDFKGWDPFDGLNSRLFQQLPLLSKKRLPRLVWIQLFKKLPFNLRTVLGVKKGYNPKGIALFLAGYCKLSSLRGLHDESVEKINVLAKRLISLRTDNFSGNCWGYNFDWQSRAFFQPKFTPTVVATTFAANALIDAYEVTNDTVYLDAAIHSKEFILNDLNRTYSGGGKFAFSYSPQDHTSVFNASLLGARLLSRIYSYTNDHELKELAKNAVDYCVDFQNNDGSWMYSPLPYHGWIDNFHTGFNLECISDYALYTNDHSYNNSLCKGMEYYLKTFFDHKGRSKYYSDSLFPIDIHAPSQLVITLEKTKYFNENRELIDRVLKWTITNMQSPDGYFYYQKRKFYTNKIPYMRWSQGWMFYALSAYLKFYNFEKS